MRYEHPAYLPYIKDATLVGRHHYMWLRPYARSFLSHCFHNYRVGVACPDDSDAEVAELMDFCLSEEQRALLEFRWSRIEAYRVRQLDRPLVLGKELGMWRAHNVDDQALHLLWGHIGEQVNQLKKCNRV